MNAIISGATRGIGRAIAFELAGLGYSLALGARFKYDLLKLTNELLGKNPHHHILTRVCDFSNKNEIISFSSEVKRRFEKIDIIVNNVGCYHENTISEEKEGKLEELINMNLYSAYHLSRCFLPAMKKQKSGYIFNICSLTSFFPRYTAASYSISKAALLSFSKSLSEEMRDYNIKVTAVIPGSVNTSSWDGINVPKNELIQPDDIAKCISTCLQLSPNAFIEEIIIKPMNKNY
jgi:short-subunit dehydrogenase